ncbi:MAG TPA: M15 family metallopeptidase [Pseudolabrys sp.]|nr:M15 family metallopeptidase [Pseudolabrys sp.]
MSARRCVTGLRPIVAFALLTGAALAQSDQAALDRLVAAYPDALAGHDGTTLRWRDGAATPLFGGGKEKTFAELLRHASIADQLRIPYPRGPLQQPPAVNVDPGRFRNGAFFARMYGDCKKAEVAPHLVTVVWLPKTWGKPVRVTAVNHVDEHLRAVSAEIDALPDKIKRAAYPTAGTYNCRAVADTGQPSPHGYGIAIDLNTAASDYWFWRPHAGRIHYRNRMPREIVAIFERHGFIWGGKWYHFDTMHFEYRPEFLAGP